MAAERLSEERKLWRKDHPIVTQLSAFGPDHFRGLLQSLAPYQTDQWIYSDGSVLFLTDWEGGLYKLTFIFPPNYPTVPPRCLFTPPIFHMNVFTSGDICLSILDPLKDWSPGISIKQILIGIQNLLDEPNDQSPANQKAYDTWRKSKPEYIRQVRAQAKKMAAALD